MIRPALVFSTIAGIVLCASPETARADEIDACANAYETAQRHHKAGELKASIVDAQTCARDVCPEILKKDCSSWVTAWRAEEREKEQRERAAKEPPPEPKPKVTPQPASSASTSTSTTTTTTDDGPSRPVPTLTYLLGGVGLVALGGATAFMLNGVGIRHDLDKLQCAPSCDTDEVDRAKTSFLVADILGAAGLVAIGSALVIYVTRPEASGGTRSAGVTIIPSAGGASLRATF